MSLYKIIENAPKISIEEWESINNTSHSDPEIDWSFSFDHKQENMKDEKFKLLEVKTQRSGWYGVTLCQHKKEQSEHSNYIKEWLWFDGNEWDYHGYKRVSNCTLDN